MKHTKVLILVGVAALLAAGLYWWWHHNTIYPSTEDAYLQANVLTIAPQVSGRVTKVAVSENAYVEAGTVLVKLDIASLQATVNTAQAQFDLATQNAGASGSNVAVAQAKLVRATAALTEAKADYTRYRTLFGRGSVSKSDLDRATETRDTAQASVQEAQAALAAARDRLGAAGPENAGVRAALGALTQARIDLEHATISAPASGWIANIRLRPGQVVSVAQPLFSLIEEGEWWVDGNFKETDLERIRPGQPVSLSIDMYPGTKVNGTVESIGAGSGAVFSLLPAQNATGNWVKVTQRFPVRISLADKPQDPARQLRVGASVTATVDTSANSVK